MPKGKKIKEVAKMRYGYVRVSTKEQKEDRQIIAMKENGVDKKNWTIVNKVDRKNENSTYWGQASTRLQGFGASSPKVFI